MAPSRSKKYEAFFAGDINTVYSVWHKYASVGEEDVSLVTKIAAFSPEQAASRYATDLSVHPGYLITVESDEYTRVILPESALEPFVSEAYLVVYDIADDHAILIQVTEAEEEKS